MPEPGASVSRIALDNGLNANMVRRWIREARWAPKTPATTPGFVLVNLAVASDPWKSIRIEIPRAGGPMVVEWPLEQAHQCAALLRDLLG